MPTFSKVVLETLLEPGPTDSYKNSSTSKQQNTKSAQNHDAKKEEEKEKKNKPKHIYITPALYKTPEPTPMLDSSLSGSISPSPYVFNRKGRGGKSVNCQVQGFEIQQQQMRSEGDDESDSNENGGEMQVGDEMVDDNFLGGEIDEGRNENSVVGDDFFDPRCDSLSVASSNDFNLSVVSNQGEFFDANEDFSSNGSISTVHSCGRSIELELCATRLSLLEEIDRRKTAEDALGMMYSQWQRVSDFLLSHTGLTFPTPSNASNGMQPEIDLLEQFSQEIVVARFVAGAVGKGQAHAEAEVAAEVIIESKVKEISRLRDRLQYYEAMNHEMSQRNLEVMDVARRQRQRKRGQQKWLWGCLGFSIAIGVSVIAYSWIPHTSEHHLLSFSDAPDGSCSIASKSL